MARLVSAYANGGPLASLATISATSPSNVSSLNAWLINPHSAAVVADTRSANIAIRSAFARPIAAGTNAVAPPSGINPILVNASRKYAEAVATTRSQASASEVPTPAASPLTAATTGLSRALIASTPLLAAANAPSTP